MNDTPPPDEGSLLDEVMASASVAAMREQAEGTNFARELGDMARDTVFKGLWGRPGLDRRSRSLLTLGILIACRAEEELRVHFAFAIANGCTVAELEEVIYHATGYAGFPAANAARVAATEALRAEGLIA